MTMIPYFEIPPLHIGPIVVQSFGVLAAAGVALASWLLVREAAREGLDTAPMRDFAPWAVVGGVIGGHLMHLFLYHPEELHGPWGALQILKVWDGLSSTGGVIGGALAAVLWFRAHRLSLLRYGDVLALAIAPGWAVARLGCFTVHDHPGRLTSFPLAVAFPGGARHDLGLYDALLLAAIAVVLFALARTQLLRGRLLSLLALLYGIGRFALDFLRATDVPYADARYFGFTPAQYVCVLLVGFGVMQLARSARRPSGHTGGDEVANPRNDARAWRTNES
jgi:phosphatidylglycerol---prolipoprotein diacylglyceryl transferase